MQISQKIHSSATTQEEEKKKKKKKEDDIGEAGLKCCGCTAPSSVYSRHHFRRRA